MDTETALEWAVCSAAGTTGVEMFMPYFLNCRRVNSISVLYLSAFSKVQTGNDISMFILQDIFLNETIDVNKRIYGTAAIHTAVSKRVKRDVIVELLLKHTSCDVNLETIGMEINYTPLMKVLYDWSVETDHSKHMELKSVAYKLLSHPNIDVNKKVDGYTALHWSAGYHAWFFGACNKSLNYAGFEFLLSCRKDVDVNVQDCHGDTALHIAT